VSGFITTYSGGKFPYADPESYNFKISEIAHSLSQLNRFTGHSTKPYNVAEHSVRVSYMVPECDALPALMHDTSEAFVGDVASPLKALLPDYQQIEDRVMRAIFKQFGIALPLPESVHEADKLSCYQEGYLLVTDWRKNLDCSHLEWPFSPPIHCWGPRKSKQAFIARYAELTK
jgi:hypothetical protein